MENQNLSLPAGFQIQVLSAGEAPAGFSITENVSEKRQLISIESGTQSVDAFLFHVSDTDQIFVDAGADADVSLQFFIEPDCKSCGIFIRLGSNSAIDALAVQDPESDTVIIQRSNVGDGASVHWRNVTLGTGSHDLSSELSGANATSAVDWVFYAHGNEKCSLSARNTFLGRSGGGEITIRGVAAQKAHVRCDGMINIGPHGTGTDAYLTEDVLMLDPSAKVDAVPGLEIKTNDVKASHSATVARVTPEDLFYFAARGIAAEEARHMYVLGFLGGMLEGISDESIRDNIFESIERKFVSAA